MLKANPKSKFLNLKYKLIKVLYSQFLIPTHYEEPGKQSVIK